MRRWWFQGCAPVADGRRRWRFQGCAPVATGRWWRFQGCATAAAGRRWWRFQGCAPAAGTCGARVLGAEMTGDPALLASAFVEVIPAIILEELTGVELVTIPPGVLPLP